MQIIIHKMSMRTINKKSYRYLWLISFALLLCCSSSSEHTPSLEKNVESPASDDRVPTQPSEIDKNPIAETVHDASTEETKLNAEGKEPFDKPGILYRNGKPVLYHRGTMDPETESLLRNLRLRPIDGGTRKSATTNKR